MADKIRIRLRGYDVKILDESCDKIVQAAKRTGAKIVGPIPLPTKIERFTVNRSPHVDKKSREQFEVKTHKRLMDVTDWNPETVNVMMKLELPAGVDLEIKV